VYNTEPELGKAIKESGAPRESLYVVTKASNNMNDLEGSLKNSLKKLGLDYVDLYFCTFCLARIWKLTFIQILDPLAILRQDR
jgi:diketogulonate reductase-like aldo/keto reductase